MKKTTTAIATIIATAAISNIACTVSQYRTVNKRMVHPILHRNGEVPIYHVSNFVMKSYGFSTAAVLSQDCTKENAIILVDERYDKLSVKAKRFAVGHEIAHLMNIEYLKNGNSWRVREAGNYDEEIRCDQYSKDINHMSGIETAECLAEIFNNLPKSERRKNFKEFIARIRKYEVGYITSVPTYRIEIVPDNSNLKGLEWSNCLTVTTGPFVI